ncbi:MAG: putative DNA binding domain-containing protein [Tissierellales bacterium]|nr:putative DNA binding domain-containing protein [Tissierellales bacterium]
MIENNRVEFKSKLNDKLEKEVVGFLNSSKGGTIYIGVDDITGLPVGIEDIDGTQLKIINRIKNNILPSTLGLFEVRVEELKEEQIIAVAISSGTEKPYYIKKYGMSPKGSYIRVGNSTQEISRNMIDDLYSRRVRNSLYRIQSPRQDLTFAQLKIYYEENGLELNGNFAKNLELLMDDGRYNYNAYLFADNNGLSMKVAKYSGKDKIDLIENQEYGYCSIIKATYSILNKLDIENITKTKITSKQRIEKRIVDNIALKEAVINAIVHNDYSTEIPPVIEIFSDRIMITSTGGLPQNLSKEEFLSGVSAPRNKEIMRIFKDVKLVEHLGSGVKRILEVYDESVFNISQNFIRVTFMFDKELINVGENDQETTKKRPRNDQKESKNQEEILLTNSQKRIVEEMLKNNQIITARL